MRKHPKSEVQYLPEPKTPAEIQTRIRDLQIQMRGGTLNGTIKTEIIRLEKKLEGLQ